MSDTGATRYPHTGVTTRYRNSDSFSIHPDDPTTATGICRWHKTYQRDDWRADLEAQVQVTARRDVWQISATLVARDGDDVVAEKTWNEDIARDGV